MTPFAVLLLLCAGSAVAQDKEPPKKMMKKVTKYAQCDKDTTRAEFISEEPAQHVTHWSFTGCGDPFMLSWTDHGGWRFWEDRPLRKKAPFDLDCEAESLEYTLIDATTRGVEGCGRRASYVLSSAGWVANVTAKEKE